jgi:predicted AAA+ superfamily ATPase
MLEKFATAQILDRIRYENPWWKNGVTDAFYLEMPKRAYFSQFQALAKDRSIQRAVVLMGPRRVGKTVMLYHLVQQLLNEGVSPQQILFITVENPIFQQIGLDQLFALGREASGNNTANEEWFLIFDEIQYLRDWDVHLKSLMESYRSAKIIVSGSAAATLQYKSKESGAGRFTDFMLPPLTFFEFVTMWR